jgi:hypothetical protein
MLLTSVNKILEIIQPKGSIMKGNHPKVIAQSVFVPLGFSFAVQMLPNESLKNQPIGTSLKEPFPGAETHCSGGLSRFICSQRLPSGFVDLSAAVCGPSSKIITQMFLGVGSRCFPEGDFSAPCRYEMSVKITEWIARVVSNVARSVGDQRVQFPSDRAPTPDPRSGIISPWLNRPFIP